MEKGIQYKVGYKAGHEHFISHSHVSTKIKLVRLKSFSLEDLFGYVNFDTVKYHNVCVLLY